MPNSNHGTNSSFNSVSLNIPKIAVPRNSLAIGHDVESLDEIPCSTSATVADNMKAPRAGKNGLSPIHSTSSVIEADKPQYTHHTPVNALAKHLDPIADCGITRVVYERLGTSKMKLGTVEQLDETQNNKSLLQSILKAKVTEVERIQRTLDEGSDKARRRWALSAQKVSQTNKIDVEEAQKPSHAESDKNRKLSENLTEQISKTINDVAAMNLDARTDKAPASKGLKSLAKMFSKSRDTLSDTPTIFALLKASHIISVSVVTHQERESHEKELTAYEHTLRHFLAFLPDLCIVNSLRPKGSPLEEFDGVAMFADVSGFTVLCSTYGTGPENIAKLKEILNRVMGSIVDEILISGGDIVSFAGDAIFAVWRTNSVEERSSILSKIVRCSINIQHAVNVAVDKTITLRVKVGLSVGKMFAFHLESNCRNHVAVVGPAVKDVNKAEGCCTAGTIVCCKNFFKEFPKNDQFLYHQPQPGFIQLWPPKNSTKATVIDYLETLGDGNHVTLDRTKVLQKISDDLVKQDVLKRYIPDYLRLQLEDGQGTGMASQLRTITTLFISLVFADSVNVSGEHENVQDALTCIDEIVDKMNGTLNKIFTFDKGCTILVAFGTQGFKMNDDPRRALKTAQMILPSLQSKVTNFQGVSIGVTTGQCYCGVVGHEERHEYTVIGHQVNLACRLMSNYPFCVACDESTRKLSTLPENKFTVLPPKVLKGVPPGGLYYKFNGSGEDISDGIFKARTSIDRAADKVVRLVGRAKELDGLYACMSAVEGTEPNKGQNIIIIEAQAGFGKSRLLDQYVLIGNHRNYKVIMTPLVIDEMTTPFFAVKMVMYKLLELYKPTNSKNKEGVIARYVPEYMRPDMCLLNDLLGTRFKRDSSRDLSFKNLRKLLKLIIKEIVGAGLYLFIIDNTEYMDQHSWDFLTDLVGLKNKVILILSTRKTSRRCSKAESQILGSSRAKKFELNAFSEEEVEEFSRAVLDVKKVPIELVKVLTEKTRGIPQYCEGLLKKMLKEQVIKVVDDVDAKRALTSKQTNKRFSIFDMRPPTISLDKSTNRLFDEDGVNLPGTPDPPEMSVGCGGCMKGFHESLNTVSLQRLETLEEMSQTKLCVLNESVNLFDVTLPDSLKELFLSQFDRLSVTEQVTLKCCAVLGTHFSLSLLKSVLPHRNSSDIHQSVRVMIKEQLLECGGTFGLGNVCSNKDCSEIGAKAADQLDELGVCEVMRFSTQFSAEIVRELLLPEQRIRIHETAAIVLEKKILSYEFCCKKEFFGNVFKISAMGETVVPDWSRQSGASGPGNACDCHAMFTTIYPQIIRHYQEAGAYHSLFEALCSAGALGMALSFSFEAMSYLEEALNITKSRTKLNDRHRACLSSLLCLAVYMCPTPTTQRLYREAIQLGGHAQVVYNVSCLSYLCGKEKNEEAGN